MTGSALNGCRDFTAFALRKIEADFQRSADTHLIQLELPGNGDIDVYLKDESVHPTGSLKHRLARSLFLYALCNGWINASTPIIESSSGSTAISEAYFARLLGLRFIAVIPKHTSKEKIAQIEFFGGECHLVEPAAIYSESARLAAELKGHYMDQFTYAERATDWRGNNNIAESIYTQLRCERHPVPRYVVVSAGTGGTSATFGRYIRYCMRSSCTELVVVDPEHSVFHDYYLSRDASLTSPRGGRIEGIGRPRVEPSFQPSVIDQMIKVNDAASLAAMRALSEKLGRRVGGSTGTNLVGVLQLVDAMRARGEAGSVVTLLCDGGERYLQTYFNDDWVRAQRLALEPHLAHYRTALGL
jgi:cysteine synthase